MVLAIFAGTSILDSGMFKKFPKVNIKTKFGSVKVHVGDGFYFLQRHGPDRDILPHLINHKANIGAMKKLGVTDIISICSCGSYKKAIKPGTLVIPDDFINLDPITFYDKGVKNLFDAFIVPNISGELRKKILRECEKLDLKVRIKGTYFQVKGPRLETKAEVRMFSRFSDVVGMTMASEAELAKESGIRYAAICSVDNYGNGIGGSEIDIKSWESAKEKNLKDISTLLKNLIKVIE